MKKSSGKKVKKISNYEVYPKNGVAQTIMYQNMSSHYRRIYNAKPRIDTGPPFSLRTVKPTPKHNDWVKKQNDSFSIKQNLSTSSLDSRKCNRQGCGEQPDYSFRPQISQTNVESKLRTLRVYHPPRRRVYLPSDSLLQIKSSPDVSVPDIPWIRTTEGAKITPSKGSSSDSAYTEEGEGVWSGGESRGPTPVSDNQRVSSSENLLYIKFVRDITEEVLQKGVFTNKALKKIFQNHIEANKQYLNVRRMQEEVDKLQQELGIPSDDSLDDTSYSSRYSSTAIEKSSCSKVEDKELLDALRQLNISPSLKADIANSLGLYSTSSSTLSNVSKSEDVKHSRNTSKRATFSSPLEVIYDISQKEKLEDQKFPQSDDDSYEMLSEGSESRPITPLGLAW